jgi:hypothetical protein
LVLGVSPEVFDATRLDETGRLVHRSMLNVEKWIEEHNYQAYEPFDGLSSPLRRFTYGNLLLDRLLLQAVRQSPVNLRPLLGIKPLPSTKGRGYMASAYFGLAQLTGESNYSRKATSCLRWLMEHKSPLSHEYSWANHFDFASRGGRYSKDEPIIVWSAQIGQAFLDGFEVAGDQAFLDVAESVCRWILALDRNRTDSGICLSYHGRGQHWIHNANVLGAALLARVWRHTKNQEYLDVAAGAIEYTCRRQRPDASWWYGEDQKYQWIDNFHTGYVLDSIRIYVDSTGDRTFEESMSRGLDYYKRHFFREDGCPRYYHDRTQPIDSQCAAQSIETLSSFSDLDPECLPLAKKVALWTIRNMQDRDGHFYYRVYPFMKSKAPMLHWAQATMYKGLALLLSRLVPPVSDARPFQF